MSDLFEILKELPPYIDARGVQRWYNNANELHRLYDRPAVISSTDQHWFLYGKRHRDNDQPAIIWKDGTSFWYKDGIQHRENDMPAVEFADGRKEWYLKGELIRSIET